MVNLRFHQQLSLPALIQFNESLIYKNGDLYLSCEAGDNSFSEDESCSEISDEGINSLICANVCTKQNYSSQMQPYLTVPRIQVCVRKRPLSRKEELQNDPDVIEISTTGHVSVNEPHYLVDLSEYIESHTFRLDHTFDETISTYEIYRKTAAPLVHSTFRGAMATCFAYGQTGSGKSFTMIGPVETNGVYRSLDRGLYGMVVNDIFRLLNSEAKYSKYFISIAFFEIYCNRVYDLLYRRNVVRVLEDSNGIVRLLGLSEVTVENSNETLSLLRRSCRLRSSGQTALNATSSRSHAIFQINLRSDQSLIGRFSLVDLAGNERGSDLSEVSTMGSSNSNMTVTRRIESGEINKSLLALKECIRAMYRCGRRYKESESTPEFAEGSIHLPFRNSKLTQVLRESFVGQRARTCMIAMVAPALSCAEHSLNTLRYAQLMKRLPPFETWPKVATKPQSNPAKSSKVSNESCEGSAGSDPCSRSCSSDGAFKTGGETDSQGNISALISQHRNLLRVIDVDKRSGQASSITVILFRIQEMHRWISIHQQLLELSELGQSSYRENLLKITTSQMKAISNLRRGLLNANASGPIIMYQC